MSVLPRVSGREVVAVFAIRGYEKDRQKGRDETLAAVALVQRHSYRCLSDQE